MVAVERVERNAIGRETIHAVRDGAYWGWAFCGVVAVAVWLARGVPSPGTAAAAAGLAAVGVALAAWRAWRRAEGQDADERRAAAALTARRWAVGYALAAALIPAAHLAAARPAAAAVVAVAVLVALAEVAIVTIPLRTRLRLLARLRTGARAVAGDQARVGRAVWRGMHLLRVQVTVPGEWAVHRDTKRDDLVQRMMWEVCGPPPRTPAEARARPDYLSIFDHSRLTIARVPSLPHHLAARDWGQYGAIVAGQTHADVADAVIDGVPVALYRPRAHALVVGGTQHGKSSGVRAWVVDGLTHNVFPGGVWCVDGKGSGSMAPLMGRRGVHAVAHTPEEWAHVLVDLVAPEVRRRYGEILEWRAGRAASKPRHRRALVVLDEVQQVLMARPDLAETLDTLARQALEAGVILWVITQRPDARDAVPGAVRDQLLDRITFGPLSGAGAKMAFDIAGDGDWHRAMGVAPVPGRALVWIDGTWRHLQAPWLPIPADAPEVEPLYPPRAAERHRERAADHGRADDPDPFGYGPPPPPEPRPAPRPSATWPPPPDGAAEDAAYDPRTARRRRRRTD